jgi:glycosyltransferase involved in cell wall biosynthesis
MGWQIEALRDTIRNHPEHGGKLLWFDDVGDLELEQIYQACEGVIIASHAEGFGLPLIEALGHLKPVLARDLPIFRIHEERGVRYFPAAGDAAALGPASGTGSWT